MPVKRNPMENTKSDPETNLVWIDSEWTGFDFESCTILQIATIVTNSDLEVVAESEEIVIHQPEEVIRKIDRSDKVRNGFFESGFIEKVRSSKISISDAENLVIKFLKEHVAEQKSPLCGNSVYMDRMFLRKHMPRLNAYLDYRVIDVSTIKELSLRWTTIPKFNKKEKHRALDDIKESIEELKYYKKTFLRL